MAITSADNLIGRLEKYQNHAAWRVRASFERDMDRVSVARFTNVSSHSNVGKNWWPVAISVFDIHAACGAFLVFEWIKMVELSSIFRKEIIRNGGVWSMHNKTEFHVACKNSVIPAEKDIVFRVYNGDTKQRLYFWVTVNIKKSCNRFKWLWGLLHGQKPWCNRVH